MKKILYLLCMSAKYLLIGILLTASLNSLLLASEGNAQIKSIHEVYLDLNLENEKLVDALKTIEKRTNFNFVFTKNDLPRDLRVSIDAREQTIGNILMEFSRQARVSFQQVNQNISVRKINELSGDETIEKIEVIIQSRTVTGRVTSMEDNEGLPGVNVVEKGTSNGTVTDVEGNYSLEVAEGATLVFSSVGYITQEAAIGNQSTIDILLREDITALEEIVVTSFGIRKTKQELTYATQEVEGEDVAKVGNPNVLNGLQGKVAGVTVKLSSGMPGRSPSINIRGSRSFTGNNEPLYVIDGAPVSGRALDINPSDIASINVLKGPAASALYGLRASNGVVVITTKSGQSSDGKPTVSFDTFYSLDQVGMLPDLQETFAQGSNGNFAINSPFTWGPRISEVGTYTNELGEEEMARSYDNDEAFYQNGYTANTNLTIANNNEAGSYYLGIGYNTQEGIVPSTDLQRFNIKLNGKYKISERFTTSISLNYSDLEVNDFPDLVGNANYFRSLTDVPPSYNLAGKPYSFPNNPYRQLYFRSTQNNPYWIVNNNNRNSRTPRTFGNMFLEYAFNDNLSLNYRFGLDNFSTSRTDFRELGTGPQGRTNSPSGGELILQNITSNQINSNVYLSYVKALNESLKIDFTIGNEIYDQRTEVITTTGENFVTGGWPNLDNATIINSSNSESNQRIVGFYGNLNIGWQDKVFLNATGRNDYVSNMPAENRSFFYPSLGLSVVLTEAVPSLQTFMSFAKLRATVAEVGQAGPLYVNNTGFRASNPGGFVFPYNGLAAFTQFPTRIDPDLEPENTQSYEFGFDIRFFDDRVGLDYTYYNSTSQGQIFNVPLPLSTGAASEIRNAGEMSSKGHEIILNLNPVRSANFNWGFITNFNSYENKVVELAEGINRIDINSGIIVAERGYDYPSILGQAYFKDPQTGKVVVQSNSSASGYGMPIINPEFGIIGSAIPDFEMNFINNFTYKDLSLSFQIDWRSGGQMFSQSYTETRWRGSNGVTRDREEEVILDAMKGNIEQGELQVDGENDIPIKKDFAYYTAIGRWSPTEQSLQDASFVRFRELSFTYRLPNQLLNNIFVKEASVYFTGRNLFIITDSFTDPEVNHSDNRSSNTAGLEWSQIPQTKSYGLGVRVKF